jgi:hypothetical protein
MATFDRVLDSVSEMSLEEQEAIAATVRRRVAEVRRAQVVAAVKEARAEFKEGALKPKSPAAIMKLIGV